MSAAKEGSFPWAVKQWLKGKDIERDVDPTADGRAVRVADAKDFGALYPRDLDACDWFAVDPTKERR